MKRLTLCAGALLLMGVASVKAESLEELLLQKGIVTQEELDTIKTQSTVSHKKNATRIEFPEFGMTSSLSVVLRERYTFTDSDQKDTSSFDTKTARVYYNGSALNDQIAYALMGDFVGDTSQSKNSPALKDAYIQWQPTKQYEARLGQYLTAVSRQVNTNPAKLQFPDFSLPTSFFNLGRQQGATVGAKLADSKLSVKAGVFNGSSTDEGENRAGLDTKTTEILSARYQPFGEIDPFEEADVGNSQKFGLSLGAAYAFAEADMTLDPLTNPVGSVNSVDSNTLSMDLIAKYRGWSVSAEYYQRKDDGNVSGVVEPNGFHVQSGFFLVPGKSELAARYSVVDCDTGTGAGTCFGVDTLEEVSGVFNYYVYGNALKASLAYTTIKKEFLAEDKPNQTKDLWMLQLSSFF